MGKMHQKLLEPGGKDVGESLNVSVITIGIVMTSEHHGMSFDGHALPNRLDA